MFPGDSQSRFQRYQLNQPVQERRRIGAVGARAVCSKLECTGDEAGRTLAAESLIGVAPDKLPMKVTREQLYNEVWAEPMTTVAKRYEVSSNYLARICERLNIPRPGRGFWQQRAVGAEVEVEPLPEAQPGDEIEWARDGSRPATAPMSSRLWKSDAERPAVHPPVDVSRDHFDDVRPGHEKVYVVPRKTKLVDVFVTRATLAEL